MRPNSFVLALALACAPLAAAQEALKPQFSPLVQERIAWMATRPDTTLDVAALRPLETVKGAAKPTTLKSARTGRESIDPAALAAAIALVEPMTTQSLLVWHKGRLQLEWYGRGFDAASRSSPASMMKPVMALAMGAAIASGKIASVDDPVGKYLTEWKDDPRGKITIRQVLRMETGLAMSPSNPAQPETMLHLIGDDIAGVALATPLAKAPGTEFQYNNVSSSIGGLVIERATGMRFAEWLSQSVWAPIGAQDASVWLDREGGFARTYCCLIATARDWVEVGLLIKNDGRANGRRILPAEWIAAQTSGGPLNANFGYQTWIASPHAPKRSYGPAVPLTIPANEPFLAKDMVYFDGSGAQRVYISKAEDLVIVRIGRANFAWDDSKLPNIIVGGIRR
jgi:CubicO group peptidase (beta-lactamase class C family)